MYRLYTLCTMNVSPVMICLHHYSNDWINSQWL